MSRRGFNLEELRKILNKDVAPWFRMEFAIHGLVLSLVFVGLATITRHYGKRSVLAESNLTIAYSSAWLMVMVGVAYGAYTSYSHYRAEEVVKAVERGKSPYSGLHLFFAGAIDSQQRFLMEGVLRGIFGAAPLVRIAEFRQVCAGTVVRLEGGTREDLEAVAEALWHSVWEDGFAQRAQLIENHAPVEQQVNVAGDATFNLAPAELQEIIARLEGLQRLGGDLSAMRAHLERIELRLAEEGEVPALVRRWGGEE